MLFDVSNRATTESVALQFLSADGVTAADLQKATVSGMPIVRYTGADGTMVEFWVRDLAAGVLFSAGGPNSRRFLEAYLTALLA